MRQLLFKAQLEGPRLQATDRLFLTELMTKLVCRVAVCLLSLCAASGSAHDARDGGGTGAALLQTLLSRLDGVSFRAPGREGSAARPEAVHVHRHSMP